MIKRIDHLVLTVQNLQETIDFYTSVLGWKKKHLAQAEKSCVLAIKKSTCMRPVMNSNLKPSTRSRDLAIYV